MICLAKDALMRPGGTIVVGHQFDRREPSCHAASSSVRQRVSRVVRVDASWEQRKEIKVLQFLEPQSSTSVSGHSSSTSMPFCIL